MIRPNDLRLTFRDLVEDDAAAVLELVRSVFECAKTTLISPEEFSIGEEEERVYLRNFHQSKCNLAVGAFEEGRLVGILFLEQLSKLRTRHRAVLGFSVHPRIWSRGVGTRLLRFVLSHPETRNKFRQLEASVLSNNIASKRLLLSAGFQQIGTVPNAVLLDDTSLDETLFVLELR